METLKPPVNPADYYRSQFSFYTGRVREMKKRLRWMAFFRLAVFLATIIMAVVATRWGLTAVVIFISAGISVFLATLVRYLRMQRQLMKDENLVEINQKELKALEGDYSMFENGEEFDDPDHPFANDLDIFGPGSLFQFYNRSATSVGKQRLADFFSKPLTDPDQILTRQKAVGELAAKPGFRQEFLATGYQQKENVTDKDDLLRWVNELPEFGHWKFKFFLVIIPLLTLTVLILSSLSVISPSWVMVYLIVPFGFLGNYLKKINRKHFVLSRKAELVKKYSGLLAVIEKGIESRGTPSLLQPSEATRKLSAILNAFDTRNNWLMGFILNFLFLWDLIQVIRTEQWQEQYKDELPKWIELLAETDALCSLANFHFNHPGSIFPVINVEEILLEAKELGHPLISGDHRVTNPANLFCRRHFIIVTGANMAGKSTYLRTVGVSLVMAMAGSAVIAQEMSFRPAGLVTSIRTKDSLQKNESYFYAELKRLKYIIEKLQNGEKLLILLDEILKGTNSRDKQSGSMALVGKLLRYEASGIIATHDLALGDLEKTYPENITNKSFEVIIENDALVFDYKLKDGIARQMNATFLMKKMGITD